MNAAERNEEQALLELKRKMSPQKQQEMAELLGNELKRREAMKQGSRTAVTMNSNVKTSAMSGSLSSADLGDVYADADRGIQEARVRALEEKLMAAKRETKRLGGIMPSRALVPSLGGKYNRAGSTLGGSEEGLMDLARFEQGKLSKNVPAILFGCALIAVIVLKVGKEMQLFEGQKAWTDEVSSNRNQDRASLLNPAENLDKIDVTSRPLTSETGVMPINLATTSEIGSDLERSLLLQLDRRRVELEQRREILDKKEVELEQQAKLVSGKVTELKTLINKLSVIRTAKDSKYEARLEQLASVYSAMVPKEASSLIAKLDEDIALGLLERLSGKRMAQILGGMDQERALELTRLLTSKKKL